MILPQSYRRKNTKRETNCFSANAPTATAASMGTRMFSINLENGTFNCFRSGCAKHGHFVELARDFGFELDFGETKNISSYRRRKLKPDLRQSHIWNQRIGEAVCRRYRITTARDNPNVLVFPSMTKTISCSL